jgi:hypothetical protein
VAAGLMPRRRASLASAAAAAALAVSVAACGIGATGSPASFPVQSVGPAATVTAAVGQTRGAIVAALAPLSLQVDDPDQPFRPSESRLTADAPRAVYQVVLPQDPDGGYIVVYEFRDANLARDAGNDLAGYLGTGAGRVAYPLDAQHTIRQLGTTLIFYTFSPSIAQDPGAAKIAEGLATLGIGFAPPR